MRAKPLTSEARPGAPRHPARRGARHRRTGRTPRYALRIATRHPDPAGTRHVPRRPGWGPKRPPLTPATPAAGDLAPFGGRLTRGSRRAAYITPPPPPAAPNPAAGTSPTSLSAAAGECRGVSKPLRSAGGPEGARRRQYGRALASIRRYAPLLPRRVATAPLTPAGTSPTSPAGGPAAGRRARSRSDRPTQTARAGAWPPAQGRLTNRRQASLPQVSRPALLA